MSHISPPAGRKIPDFFTKMLHKVQHFCEKEKKSTMLLQVMLLFGGSNTWFERPPRNLCQLHKLRRPLRTELFASGRVEDFILFHKTYAPCAYVL